MQQQKTETLSLPSNLGQERPIGKSQVCALVAKEQGEWTFPLQWRAGEICPQQVPTVRNSPNRKRGFRQQGKQTTLLNSVPVFCICFLYIDFSLQIWITVAPSQELFVGFLNNGPLQWKHFQVNWIQGVSESPCPRGNQQHCMMSQKKYPHEGAPWWLSG